MRLIILLAWLLALGVTRGNPIFLEHDIYIASEKLVVRLEAGSALIEGRFRFKSAVGGKNDPRHKASVHLTLPIWFPDRFQPWNDAATQTFMQVFPSSFHAFDKLSPQQSQVWQECVGLKVLWGGKPLESFGFSVSSIHPIFAYRRSKSPYEIHGFREVAPEFDFEPNLLKGTPEVIIRYRQPLRFNRSGEAHFVYMPLFNHLPDGLTTTDLGQYSMTVEDAQGAALKVNGKLHAPASQPLRLPLTHRQVIRIERPASPGK